MATAAKTSTSKRRTPAVPTKARRVARPGKHLRAVAKHKTSPVHSAPKATPKPSGGGINNYAKALRYLANLTDFERLRIVRYNNVNFDLDRMRSLLKKLGNPQDRFRSIHVAGTKGKGSTCAMIASILQACGYKTGLYTSPHLVDVRERIQINGQMIPQSDLAQLIRQVEPIVSKMKPMPSFFDVFTAVAFKYFADQKVEIAVVETGLGGRLDSTNVLNPEVTAITSISKDHVQQLGPTLAHIAAEKAGIFKPGVPAVSVMQEPAVEAVLKQTAEKVGIRWTSAASRLNSATASNPAGCSARTTASA